MNFRRFFCLYQFFCMFVSTKSLGAIQKLYFFNDKELSAMGSKSERLVHQFLELLVNPTAVTPHTNLFSMTKKKNFVTNSEHATVTPISEFHTQTFFNTINEFLTHVEPSTYIEVQNELLNTFLESDTLKTEELRSIVYYTTEQINFLSKLKSLWLNFVQYNNIKIKEA